MKTSLKLKRIAPLFVLVLILIINILFVIANFDNLADFGSFIASGRLANMGKNPYSIEYPLVFKVDFGKNGPSGIAPNLNPPISVLLFQWISKFNAHDSMVVWRFFTFTLMFITIYFLHKEYPLPGTTGFIRFFWALCFAGFWHTIELGQIYAILFFLTTSAWILNNKDKKMLAGIFIGFAIAIKPNLIIWAILLLATKNWKVIISAFISGLFLSIIPILTSGFNIYKQWIECIANYGNALLDFPANNSFQGLTVRFGSIDAGIYLGIVLLLVILVIVYKKHVNKNIINGLGMAASLLISPIAWSGYTLLFMPLFFIIKKWNLSLSIAASILVIPVFIILKIFNINPLTNIIFGWFYGWSILLIVYWLIKNSIQQPRNIFINDFENI